jgi:hypothetical protein
LWSTIVLVLLAQVAAPPAADVQAKARAVALLKEGNAAYDAQKFSVALDKFQAAFSIYPSPKLQFNIAQANRELGLPVEALMAFQKFLAEPGDAGPDIVADARRSVVQLTAKLGQIKITCSTPDATVSVDGKTVGRTPIAAPIWVVPGQHRIALKHPSYLPATVDLTTVAGGTSTLAPQLRPPEVVPHQVVVSAPVATTTAETQLVASPSQPGGSVWSRQRWYFWTAAAGTVVFASTAIVAGLSARSRFYELQGSCGKTSAGCSDSDISSVTSRETVANVFWVLAGASAVGTGVSFYLDNREAGFSVALRF